MTNICILNPDPFEVRVHVDFENAMIETLENNI